MKTIMNVFRSILLPGIALCAVLLSAAPALAQSIGRVLVASGEVTVVRGSATQPATPGLALQVGDRVRTGAAGTAQIWFTDTSIVALRNGSDFVVERYSFTNSLTDNLVFNLVRGGYRTVAGLIGVQDRKAYQIKTKMATLGRRGTQYGIVYCEQDCPLPEGGLAPDGLYGGVYDGRISVTNSTPEAQFGRDEYFYVASINSIPQPLLGPPAFFADRLTGLAKNAQKPASEPPASKEAAPEESEGASAPPPPAPYSTTENRTGSGAPSVVQALSSVALLSANSLQEINGSVASYNFAVAVPSSALTTSGTGPSQTLTAFNMNPLFTFSGVVGGGGIDMAGFDTDSGVYYGRWISGSLTSGSNQAPQLAPGTQTSGMGVHYLYGTPTADSVIAAKTGSAQYVDVVGTQPTASNGQTASSFNIGPININFTSRTGVIQSVLVNFPTSQWNFSNLPFTLDVNPGQGASFSANLVNAGSCVGAGCGPVQGSNTARADFLGRFIGSSGNFLGLTFQGNSGGNTPSGNPNLTMGMVRLFKCPTCP
ncbi:MAG: FecR domain-containing protein [Betaproteobacteria bacterium]|nr:FecR domain-containing protein [Betaproteobacteria bacterium]